MSNNQLALDLELVAKPLEINKFYVEGIGYNDSIHAIVVAKRFAKRYNRPIEVTRINQSCLPTIVRILIYTAYP